MSENLSIIPASPDTVLGLDMDLTITADRGFFADLARNLSEQGGRVVVVAARPPQLLAGLWQELEQAGIHCDEAHCLPILEDAVATCPHRDALGWYKSYLWHKARIAREGGFTHYVDDEAAVHALFRTFAPDVRIHYPWELLPSIGKDSLASSASGPARACPGTGSSGGTRPAPGASMPEEDYNAEALAELRNYPGIPFLTLGEMPPGEIVAGHIPPTPEDVTGTTRAYSVCVEGEGFPGVVKALGGEVLGGAPMYLTGCWLIVLPKEVALRPGEVSAGGSMCNFTYVHRF